MNPVTGLALGRIAIGTVALASPELAGKLFRLDSAANPQLGYMSRMFGSREVALGAITLVAKGSARRKLIGLGIAVDAADAFAGVDALRNGSVSRSTAVGLTVPALGAVVAGAIGLIRA
ncbi:hypothetical protein [Marmoricola sp. RAF53]|uniref:hypothetical protein n=1 Tax=Marmoricola sp. RAF53 TaxID=3233059 RepID=UPI003F966658